MINIKQKTIKALKDGEISADAFANELLAAYPAKEIALAFAELITTSETVYQLPKIPISKEMFEAHFRLIGFNADGTQSTRGRKPKKAKE